MGKVVKIVAAVFALTLCVQVAQARDDLPPPEPQRVVVMVAAAGLQEAFAPMVQAVRGQLSDLPIVFQMYWVDSYENDLPSQEEVANRVAAKTGADVVFWYDLSRSDRLYLYIAVPALGRVLVRRLEGSGRGANETLAIILRSSIDAIINGELSREIPENREPADGEPQPEESNPKSEGAEEKTEPAPVGSEPEALPVPPIQLPGAPADLVPPSAPVRRFPQKTVEIGAAYGFEALGKAHPQVHGFALGLDAHIQSGWSVHASYTFFPPIEDTRAGVRVVLRRHPAWVGAKYTKVIDRVDVGAGLSLCIDHISEKISSEFDTMTPAKGESEIQVAAAPMVNFGIRATPVLRFFASAGIRIPMNPVEYVVDATSNMFKLFDFWPVQPVARVGIAAGFL